MSIEHSEFVPAEKQRNLGPTPEAILHQQSEENSQNEQRASEYRNVFLARQKAKE